MNRSAYGDAFRELLSTALPIVGSMVSGLVMMLTDRICLARYSADALMASGPAIYTAMGINALFIATVNLTRIFVGEANGRKDATATANAGRNGIATALLLGIVLVALQPLISKIPYLSSRPANIQKLESEFLSVMPFYGFFMIMNASFASLFIGTLRTRVSMVVAMIGNGLNALFAVGFVYGYCGLPELGMAGSAVGTLTATATVSLIYVVAIYRSKILAPLSGHFWDERLLPAVKQALKVGVPSGVGSSLELFSNAAFVWIVGGISVHAMVANNIALAVNYVTIIPIIGLGIGTSALVANKAGRRDETGIRATIRVAFMTASAYVFTMALAQTLAPRLFALAFLSDKVSEADRVLTDSTIRALWTYAAAFMVSMIMSGVLEARKCTKIVFWTRMIVSWGINIPSIAYLSSRSAGQSEQVPFIWVVGAVFELMVGLVYLTIYARRTFAAAPVLAEAVTPMTIEGERA